ADVVAFDLRAQRFARTEKLFLADEFVERARAHALGERLVGRGDVRVSGRGGAFGGEAHALLESKSFGGKEGREGWLEAEQFSGIRSQVSACRLSVNWWL